MTYQLIENFAAGLDVRKSPLTAPAGTLLRLKNAVITPGGEIAKRRAFVKTADLPSNSFGLAASENALYVFGRNVLPIVPPSGVASVGLFNKQVPNSASDLVQADFDVFDGRVYLSCSQPSGSGAGQNPHYWNKDGGYLLEAVTEGHGKGYSIRAFKNKMYAVNGSQLSFSANNYPDAWATPTTVPPILPDTAPADIKGQGFINLSMVDADSEVLTSLEVYYKQLAVFSSEAIQIWSVDPDPLQNAFSQLLRGSGTTAPLSTLQYGSGDVLFLDRSGVRSVKARDSSNSAAVSDIGSPIDSILAQLYIDMGRLRMSKAISVLEPFVGRFWLILENTAYVLSYFPSPKITAWSFFTLPFTAQYAVTCNGRIFMRDTANGLWVYGGPDGNTYENCGVEVRLPYLDGKKPGHRKQFQAFDTTVGYSSTPPVLGAPGPPYTGSWRVAVSFDFNNPDAEEDIGTFDRPTWNAGRAEMVGYDSHFSLRFYNNDSLPATLSNCAAHYTMADEEA
jgi:hypothetical protein